MTPTLREAILRHWEMYVGRETCWGTVVEVGPNYYKIQSGGNIWEWSADGTSKVHRDMNMRIQLFEKVYNLEEMTLTIKVVFGSILIEPPPKRTVYLSNTEMTTERKEDSVLEVTPDSIKVMI